MPTRKVTKETSLAAKPKAQRSTPVAETASKARVKTVKHSKAAAPAAVETPNVELSMPSAHEQIAKIAYGYWEARGYEAGSSEQDWLRAEQEYLSRA